MGVSNQEVIISKQFPFKLELLIAVHLDNICSSKTIQDKMVAMHLYISLICYVTFEMKITQSSDLHILMSVLLYKH